MDRRTHRRAIAALALLIGASSGQAQPSNATCSDILDITVHGEHVIGDYVTGIGHDVLDWPADGSEIGEAVAANRGAKTPGGPGPGYHFEHGVAPGASFCTDSKSPGAHF